MFPHYVKVGICVFTGSQPRWIQAEGSVSLLWAVVSMSVLFSESSPLLRFPQACAPLQGGWGWEGVSPWDQGGDLPIGSVCRVCCAV